MDEPDTDSTLKPSPGTEQILGGLLLHALMQSYDNIDIDLGEVHEAARQPLCDYASGRDGRCLNCDQLATHEWHQPAFSDGWGTRAILGYVVEAAVAGDDAGAWLALWAEAYSQHHAAAALAAAAPSNRLGRAAETALLESMAVDSMAGTVPVYDRRRGTFHTYTWANAAAATIHSGRSRL